MCVSFLSGKNQKLQVIYRIIHILLHMLEEHFIFIDFIGNKTISSSQVYRDNHCLCTMKGSFSEDLLAFSASGFSKVKWEKEDGFCCQDTPGFHIFTHKSLKLKLTLWSRKVMWKEFLSHLSVPINRQKILWAIDTEVLEKLKAELKQCQNFILAETAFPNDEQNPKDKRYRLGASVSQKPRACLEQEWNQMSEICIYMKPQIMDEKHSGNWTHMEIVLESFN